MSSEIAISNKYISESNNEFVERKGIGHPDTMSDAIAEKVSELYTKYFYAKYGKFAHHWFDKVMIIGGSSNIEYGVGVLINPYKVIFAGKCVKRVGGEEVPILSIFQEAIDSVFSKSLTNYIPGKDAIIIDYTVDYHGAGRKSIRYQPESIDDLVTFDLYKMVSNDCNLLSSHYPLTQLEILVYNTEKYINSSQFKEIFVESGWDVKIIASKLNDDYEIIINIPILAGKINSKSDYDILIKKYKQNIKKYIFSKFGMKPKVIINPQDETGQPYLTSLGSAADTGDVGVVGRGNRINGLITPMKAMSIEAPSGKNPIDHTGKIYGVLCERIAKSIYNQINIPVEVHILTYKEVPLLKPSNIYVNLQSEKIDDKLTKTIEKICLEEISGLEIIINDLFQGELELW